MAARSELAPISTELNPEQEAAAMRTKLNTMRELQGKAGVPNADLDAFIQAFPEVEEDLKTLDFNSAGQIVVMASDMLDDFLVDRPTSRPGFKTEAEARAEGRIDADGNAIKGWQFAEPNSEDNWATIPAPREIKVEKPSLQGDLKKLGYNDQNWRPFLEKVVREGGLAGRAGYEVWDRGGDTSSAEKLLKIAPNFADIGGFSKWELDFYSDDLDWLRDQATVENLAMIAVLPHEKPATDKPEALPETGVALEKEFTTLGYNARNWAPFLKMVNADSGLYTSGDKYHAERLMRSAATFDKFIRMSTGELQIYSDDLDWLRETSTLYRLHTLVLIDPKPKPAEPAPQRAAPAEVVAVQTESPEDLDAEAEAFSFGDATGKFAFDVDSSTGTTTRASAPAAPSSETPTLASTSSAHPDDTKVVPEKPVYTDADIKSEADFITKRLHNSPLEDYYSEKSGDKTAGKIVAKLPTDINDPDYKFSRIHHFLGKDESVQEIKDFSELDVTVDSKPVEWRATTEYKDGTWVNPDTGKRVGVVNGTTIEWRPKAPALVAVAEPVPPVPEAPAPAAPETEPNSEVTAHQLATALYNVRNDDAIIVREEALARKAGEKAQKAWFKAGKEDFKAEKAVHEANVVRLTGERATALALLKANETTESYALAMKDESGSALLALGLSEVNSAVLARAEASAAQPEAVVTQVTPPADVVEDKEEEAVAFLSKDKLHEKAVQLKEEREVVVKLTAQRDALVSKKADLPSDDATLTEEIATLDADIGTVPDHEGKYVKSVRTLTVAISEQVNNPDYASVLYDVFSQEIKDKDSRLALNLPTPRPNIVAPIDLVDPSVLADTTPVEPAPSPEGSPAEVVTQITPPPAGDGQTVTAADDGKAITDENNGEATPGDDAKTVG